MPDYFLITTLIFALLTAAFLFLYIKQYLANQKFKEYPQHLLVENRKKGLEILHYAMQKAQAIIGISEIEGVKITSSAKQNMHMWEEKEKTEIEQATEDFKSYLDYLTKQADFSVEKSEQMLKERVNQIVERFEQNLSSFLTETQEQSSKAVSLEMQAARQLIQTYKTEQFNLIDENIVATLEKTLNLVLGKKLTFKDHIELVYESLEKAKAEKFIA